MTNYGSQWRKWDLHVHTPDSIIHEYKCTQDEDIWKKYIIALEKLPSNIKVLGINDYLFLDGYKEVKKYKESGRLNNIDLILPIIEFRLKEFVGHAKLGRINYHIIFSDKLTTDIIEQQFLSQLYGNALLIPNKSTATWGGALSKQSLIDFGKNIKETTPSGINTPNGSDLEVGFNNINFELFKIKELLQNNYLQNNYLTAIGKTEWDDFRWDGSVADKKTLINGCDFVFIASPDSSQAIKSVEQLIKNNVNNKVLHCSDAHQFYNSEFTSKVLGHCFTWIKADTTFEGLKQVIYEPTSRVKIQVNKPQPPLHKLEKVRLKFPDNVKWDNDKFCFAGFDNEIVFSPNLTCIIGGRGSGKSTLLNLIANKIGKGDIKFFDKVKPLDIENSILFQPETIENIEYLAQNTIEKFATDTQEFTDAIYNRLNKKSSGELKKKEDEITEGLKTFDNQISLLKERTKIIHELLEVKRQLKINNNLANTFSDKIFVDTRDKLTKLQKEKSLIINSRNRYKELYENVKKIKDEYKIVSEPKNNYDDYYNELVNDLNSLYKKYSSKDYTKDKEIIQNLDNQIKEINDTIEKYLKEKGLSPENIDDAKYASKKIVELQNERQNKICALREINKKIRFFAFADLDTKIYEFKTDIGSELQKINTIFRDISEKNPTEVKSIEVKYELNQDIFDKVFDELENILNIRGEISSFRKTFIDYISSVELDAVLTCNTGIEFIHKIGAKTTQAYIKVEEIFSDNINLSIYKLLIEEEKRNIKDNKILRVYYDDKPLDNSSFGQKCTAAIVILLSLGNNPIIIDEPEAHLDSSLIANYLVELIKQQKEQRQIIFATHNANIVLNADAELIVKLENNDGTTSVINFTIEDLKYREDLLKLEGGKEAFKKREKKYNI